MFVSSVASAGDGKADFATFKLKILKEIFVNVYLSLAHVGDAYGTSCLSSKTF